MQRQLGVYRKRIIKRKTRMGTTMPDIRYDDEEKGWHDFINFLEEKYQRVTIMFSTFFLVLTSILYIMYLRLDNNATKTLSFGIVIPKSQPQYYIAAIAAISTAIIFLISIIFYQINEHISFKISKGKNKNLISIIFYKIDELMNLKISKYKIPFISDFTNKRCVSVRDGLRELPAVFLLLMVVEPFIFFNILHGLWVSIFTLIIGVFTSVILIFNKLLYKNYYYKFIFLILLFLIFAIPLLLYKLRLV